MLFFYFNAIILLFFLSFDIGTSNVCGIFYLVLNLRHSSVTILFLFGHTTMVAVLCVILFISGMNSILLMSVDCRKKLCGSLDGLFHIYHRAVNGEGNFKVPAEDSLHLVEALRYFYLS